MLLQRLMRIFSRRVLILNLKYNKPSKPTTPNETIDHLANALNLLSQRITAASALSHATAKSFKVK